VKIVLDKNVLVSGLLSPFGAPGEIVKMAASGILGVCYDARIISEYRLVLQREKFGFDFVKINIFMEQIKLDGELIITEPLRFNLPDKDDEPFLEVAIAAGVNYLITGNKKHFPSKVGVVEILSPSEFIEKYRQGEKY